jgi:hypothetical protein
MRFRVSPFALRATEDKQGSAQLLAAEGDRILRFAVRPALFHYHVGAGFIPISANLFLRRETVEGSLKKRTSNIERPTSNAEWEKIKQQTNDLE